MYLYKVGTQLSVLISEVSLVFQRCLLREVALNLVYIQDCLNIAYSIW